MEYILIAIFMYNNATTSQAILFGSKAACEQAQVAARDFENSFTRKVWSTCVARGHYNPGG